MRFRMCDDDQAKFGGPEWLDESTAVDWLNDLDYDGLAAVERQIRADADLRVELGPDPKNEPTLLWVLDQAGSRTRVATRIPMLRVRLWLSLRAAGVDMSLADLRPKMMKVRVEARADADPPSGGAESSPTSTPDSAEATPESGTSTSASTPGSPSDTQG